MKYVDRFAAVNERLRARGIKVVVVPGATNRGRRKSGGAQDFDVIETITVHHTAVGGVADYASLGVVTNGRTGANALDGPLANYGVGRLGTVYFIAAGAANHTGATWQYRQSNRCAVGIECENDGRGEAWGKPLVTALVALIFELRSELAVAQADVLGHKEICSPTGRKPDPAGLDMHSLRRDSNEKDEDMTPEQDATLRKVSAQLDRLDALLWNIFRQDGFEFDSPDKIRKAGFPGILGKNADGTPRSNVEALGALLKKEGLQ